ncbi:MAG: glycine--tRNA ligase [Candidatus ainarchaeum sp.]|jgi:glycyl-tRNA synthetase|nr:glycine--tRNA ligase [Candidatus ainarchaeum sp.]
MDNLNIDRFNEMISTRAFYFPSAEIYSKNFAGFYEYGPLGNKIRLKIIDFWRKEFVNKNNFLEISGSIILPEPVFQASGHLKNFDDPIATCSKTGKSYKLDKYLSEKLNLEIPEGLSIEEYQKLITDNNIKSEDDGDLINIKRFNLMAYINVGVQEGNKGYLRGESCQSIFLDFPRIYKSSRNTLPITLSQHGKVYRNEISPRQGLIRCREFEQLETEMFFDPDKIDDCDLSSIQDYKIRFLLLKDGVEKDYTVKEITENKISLGNLLTFYLYLKQKFLDDIGITHEKLRFREVPDNDRAFYSKQTFDLEVNSSLGWIELFSFNYRTDHDLKAHGQGSKKDLSVKEEGKTINPHVLEVSSIGLDRLFYVLLENSFEVKKEGEELRNILHLKPKISPYFCAILPLVKKDGILEIGQELLSDILDKNFGVFEVFFDEKGSIGKRYARLDEIGCNYCITIDHQTKEDNTVTIRDRDSFDQKRVNVSNLSKILFDLYFEKINFKDL